MRSSKFLLLGDTGLVLQRESMDALGLDGYNIKIAKGIEIPQISVYQIKRPTVNQSSERKESEYG